MTILKAIRNMREKTTINTPSKNSEQGHADDKSTEDEDDIAYDNQEWADEKKRKKHPKHNRITPSQKKTKQ